MTLHHETGQVENSPNPYHQAPHPSLIPEEKNGRAKEGKPVGCFTAARFDDKQFQVIGVQESQFSFGETPFKPRGPVRKPILPEFHFKKCFIYFSILFQISSLEQPTVRIKNLWIELCHTIRKTHVNDKPRKNIQ